MFKKAKPTFLSRAGRQGAPSARKPFAKKNTKRNLGKEAANTGKRANTVKASRKVIKNGRVSPTGKAKGAVNNYRTGKKASSFPLGAKLSIDKRLSNYFMSHSPKLTSATNSPQSAPVVSKPRG